MQPNLLSLRTSPSIVDIVQKMSRSVTGHRTINLVLVSRDWCCNFRYEIGSIGTVFRKFTKKPQNICFEKWKLLGHCGISPSTDVKTTSTFSEYSVLFIYLFVTKLKFRSAQCHSRLRTRWSTIHCANYSVHGNRQLQWRGYGFWKYFGNHNQRFTLAAASCETNASTIEDF